MNNKDLLKAIIDCNRIDLIYNSHIKYIGNNIEFFFSSKVFSKEQLNYLLTIMTSCLSACLTAWVKNGGYESSKQLYERLKDCFKTLSNIYNS